MLQRFVHTDDLPSIYTAVEEVLSKEKYTDRKLTAFKYCYVPADPVDLAGNVIEPMTCLIRLQQQIIDAVAPYTVNAGAAAAFYTTPGEPDIRPSLIPYVSNFVPAQTGKNYSPHVSIGVGTTAFLDALLAKPFEAFTFSPEIGQVVASARCNAEACAPFCCATADKCHAVSFLMRKVWGVRVAFLPPRIMQL